MKNDNDKTSLLTRLKSELSAQLRGIITKEDALEKIRQIVLEYDNDK